MGKHISKSKKKMAIITSYFAGETYGLLGPQMAATLIETHTPYECMVIAVAREDDKTLLKGALSNYFGKERPLIGFSSLSGREDLFHFAKDLTEEGCFTILAGPQADVDFSGEVDCKDFPHRFQGLSGHFSCALQGPAEACFYLLAAMDDDWQRDVPGLFTIGADGAVIQNARQPWNESYFQTVRWDNIYRPEKSQIIPHHVSSAQVLQQIGCPYAARQRWAEIDYPAFLNNQKGLKADVLLKGCSFCDIAVDKGFQGSFGMETVLNQIQSVPAANGRKIPFELINENPLPGLLQLLYETGKRKIPLSRINLIMRADWFLKGSEILPKVLLRARDMGIRIVLTSVGFESFDNTILRNLNKGLTIETVLKAVSLMRRLKDEFPDVWGYTRSDGANHGFIHPTPWDSEATSQNIQEVIDRYDLAPDILPNHSTPLIIHHASGLADWIREVEKKEGVQFRRYGSIIGWWPESLELIPLQCA